MKTQQGARLKYSVEVEHNGLSSVELGRVQYPPSGILNLQNAGMAIHRWSRFNRHFQGDRRVSRDYDSIIGHPTIPSVSLELQVLPVVPPDESLSQDIDGTGQPLQFPRGTTLAKNPKENTFCLLGAVS